jgi:hypothetical protein
MTRKRFIFRIQDSGFRSQEPGARSSGVQEFRSSGVQEFRSSGAADQDGSWLLAPGS